MENCDWEGTTKEKLRDLVGQLKDLVAEQIPILEYGLYLQAQRYTCMVIAK